MKNNYCKVVQSFLPYDSETYVKINKEYEKRQEKAQNDLVHLNFKEYNKAMNSIYREVEQELSPAGRHISPSFLHLAGRYLTNVAEQGLDMRQLYKLGVKFFIEEDYVIEKDSWSYLYVNVSTKHAESSYFWIRWKSLTYPSKYINYFTDEELTENCICFEIAPKSPNSSLDYQGFYPNKWIEDLRGFLCADSNLIVMEADETCRFKRTYIAIGEDTILRLLFRNPVDETVSSAVTEIIESFISKWNSNKRRKYLIRSHTPWESDDKMSVCHCIDFGECDAEKVLTALNHELQESSLSLVELIVDVP
jgi:hypothetical protein